MDTSVPIVTSPWCGSPIGTRRVTRLRHVEHANGCVLVRPDDDLIFALLQNLPARRLNQNRARPGRS